MTNVRGAVPSSALTLIHEVSQKTNPKNKEELYAAVCSELKDRWPEEIRSICMNQMRLGTKSQIKEAILIYCKSQNWKDVLCDRHEMQDISEGAVHLIQRLAEEKGLNTKEELFDAVCDWMYETTGSNKNRTGYARAEQMGLVTTKDIRFAVDLYFNYLQFGYLKPRIARREGGEANDSG